MEARATTGEVDPILAPFLAERDEEKAARILSAIVKEHVEPTVSLIVNSVLPEGRNRDDLDAEGLRSEILLKLITRLHAFRAGPAGTAFRDFSSYVAAASRNACRSYLRAKYPERSKLKNRVRYALEHHSGLGAWKDSGGIWLCGFDYWRGKSNQAYPSGKVETLARSADLAGLVAQSRDGAWRRDLTSLLMAILELAGAPLELDDLVSVVAALYGVEEPRTLNAGSFLDFARLEDPSAAASYQGGPLDSTVDVGLVWSEIRGLPLKQRVVLLFTLEDESGLDGLSLLGNAGAASLTEVSVALEIGVLELAEMWDKLPLPDSKVAEYLGVTGQQVINLRKSAKKRLAYRLRDLRKG